jgi:hypothetical protein
MEGKCPDDCLDVLSAEEESALSALRDIVAGIRAHGGAVDMESFERALSSWGGSSIGAPSESGLRTFELGRARFYVRPAVSRPGRLEVQFIPFGK